LAHFPQIVLVLVLVLVVEALEDEDEDEDEDDRMVLTVSGTLFRRFPFRYNGRR
jgi:hypothetical protein